MEHQKPAGTPRASTKSRPLLRQLLREFWFPASMACLWAGMLFWTGPPKTIPERLTSLSAAFFFVSWLTAQYFRVKKQVKVDASLDGLQDRLERLADKLDAGVAKLHDTVTGGDTYCVARVANVFQGGPYGDLIVHVEGSELLYDVVLRVVDVDAFERCIASGKPLDDCLYETYHTVGSFGAPVEGIGRGSSLGRIELGDGPKRSFNLTWFARNGTYPQRLRLRLVDGSWRQASHILFRGQEFMDVDDCFYEADGSVNWN